ncbi:unnamed protein product [Allacma fusca]|uniref:WD repeat-containing protein 7 n=1 Tax=Allacma fusca TaxID=39272 RepID=A0A8J2KF27_9HEXA|nr:unnamed protein product [Allacma fusca]
MSTSAGLVLPIILWGKDAPTHAINTIATSPDLSCIVTGCQDGHICIWDVTKGQGTGNEFEINPRCFLIGHSGAILALAYVKFTSSSLDLIVSSSENGELCCWDSLDGRCLETSTHKTNLTHTRMQPYILAFSHDPLIFCTGYYPDVCIINPITLDTVLTLHSHVNPDWVSALHVLRPNKKLDDVILALTINGTVKVWTINESEFRERTPLYENESKQIRVRNAVQLVCCLYNNRTVLIVTWHVWQIYDAGDFSVLAQAKAPANEKWYGGNFIAPDRVVLWGVSGKSYLFKLPSNCVVESKDFHKHALKEDPFCYCVMGVPSAKPLVTAPSVIYATLGQQKILLRGDVSGKLVVWIVPEVTNNQLSQLKQDDNFRAPEYPPASISSLQTSWDLLKPCPPGILDQFDTDECRGPLLTCSIYLAQQSRLVCGREDGSIVVVPATHTVMLHLLHGRHQQYEEWPLHQLLLGHKGKVNCLVYPHGVHPRYDPAFLVSGGRDFSVILWDIVKCELVHRFCVHSGEITQILVPPNETSARMQQAICSVSSDHSAALLSLRENKCVLLASRHLFPIISIKFRPLDDFLIIGCSDGTVYVWQMETGNLDRVLHGMAGIDVLQACDENGNTLQNSDLLANPAVHFFRGLRSRNLAAIRHAAQRGLHHLHQPGTQTPADPLDHNRTRIPPLVIQGLRTNANDPESHICFFDVEALIIQLLNDEYSAVSPSTLEAQGLISQTEYCKILGLTHSDSPDAQKKIADFFGKVKDKAGDMERILKDKDKHGLLAKVKEGAEKIQAKAESALLIKQEKESASRKNSTASLGLIDGMPNQRRNRNMLFESTIPMEIAQLLLSLLLGWGLDGELDTISEGRLGLLKPLVPVSFGQISRGGFMSVMSPTWRPRQQLISQSDDLSLTQRVKEFTSLLHWEISSSITTNHLLAIIALANTLMSMQNATFVPEQERLRRANRPSTRSQPSQDDNYVTQQAASKHGWSLVATMHCVMLHEKLAQTNYQEPLVESLALRWQDRCVEVRDAAQALLLAELSRIGVEGRKQLVDHWALFLPTYTGDAFAIASIPSGGGSGGGQAPGRELLSKPEEEGDDEASKEYDEEETLSDPMKSSYENKRKQTTAVILLGVIGAEFGQEIIGRNVDSRRAAGGTEGFGVGNSNLARLTSKSLTFLLLNPPGAKSNPYSSLRRAAIDLIGRGFTVWEPFLDVSKVLLALLELCCEADHLVPSMSFGLPLTPSADACRTARHALTLIATARPAAFITTMAREVARYNTLQQNAQAIQINLSNVILNRSKPEILRVIELLIEKMQSEIVELIIEVMDIVLHCVDHGHLKTRGLGEVFPVLCRFSQVSHCAATRRIAVGAKNGNLAIYELRSSKCQNITAHSSPVTACAFSPDGKFLASYTSTENKMSFWQQSSSGMFGLGHTQTRCVKTISTIPLPDNLKNSLRGPKLIWTGSRNVSLMLADGSENRYGV